MTKLHKFLKKYTDRRDSDKLIATHIYLLFGCAFSLWKTGDIKEEAHNLPFLPHLMKLSGIIFLGLGDAFAAIIGKKYGKITLPISGKTIEGFFACFISMAIPIVYLIASYGFGD